MDDIGIKAIHVNRYSPGLGNQLIGVTGKNQMQIANVECFGLFNNHYGFSNFPKKNLFSIQINARCNAIVNINNAPVVGHLVLLGLDKELLVVRRRHQSLGDLLDNRRVDLVNGQPGQMPLVTVEPVTLISLIILVNYLIKLTAAANPSA